MKFGKGLRAINLKLCCLLLTVLLMVIATINMYFIHGLTDFSTKKDVTFDVFILNSMTFVFFALTLNREETLQRYARAIFRIKETN